MHDVMAEISKEFNLDPEIKADLVKEAGELFDEYGHEYSDCVVEEIIDDAMSAKGWLVNLFSKHPNWNAEKLQIQFSSNYKRTIDMNALYDFFDWLERTYAKEHKFVSSCPIGRDELQNILSNLEQIILEMQALNAYRMGDVFLNATVNGMSVDELLKEKSRLEGLWVREYVNTTKYNISCTSYLVSNEDARVLNKIVSLKNVVTAYFNGGISNEKEDLHICTAELADCINNIFPETAVQGKKISRILAKIAKVIGLDTYKEIRDTSFYDNNGNLVSRTKDYGWNYWQARMGDAINPFIIKRHTIISVNPIDYWTMSFGHNWASCHTIDTNNNRGAEHSYHGEYCAGTTSYLYDPSSVIFYTVDAEYDGNEFELQDKMQRCVFALQHDKMYQGRVYPDGRDGGDQGYAAQFRAIMQKVVADCLEVNNLWVVKKGTAPCCDNIYHLGGYAYADWSSCDDSSMSFLKINDIINEENRININAIGRCISCGSELDAHNSILCENCNDIHYCERCGERVYDDDICIDGYYYCCRECAEEAGYRYCFDDDEWHDEDDTHYCDYHEDYFWDDSYMVITEDGHEFYDADAANDYGYVYCENVDEWHNENDVVTDDYTGEYFYPDDDSIEAEDGSVFVNAESARSAGYVFDEDNNTWREEEAS